MSLDLPVHEMDLSSDEMDGPSTSTTSDHHHCHEHEALVVLALNLSRLELSANMGNVMGQAM